MRKLKVTAAMGGAMLCTFAACDGGVQSPASRQASFSEAEAAACTEAWQTCIDKGGDELTCKAAYHQCADQGSAAADPATDTATDPASEPPKDDPSANTGDTGSEPVANSDVCGAAIDACYAAGESAEVCKAKYEACLGSAATTTTEPGEPTPDEPPPVPSAEEECQKQTQPCFDAGYDPTLCKQKYEACVAGFYPTDVPPPVVDDCSAAAQACFDAGEDPEICKKKQETCLGYEPPPATDVCQDAFQACLAQGVDAVVCKDKLSACEGWFVEPPKDPDTSTNDKGNACLAGLDACLGVATSQTQVDACYNGFQACDWTVRQDGGQSAEGDAKF